MKIAIIAGGHLPIPPTGWGGVEHLIWNFSKELETQNKQIDKLSEQLVSEGLAIRSKEKGEDHFLINRRSDLA